MGQDPAAVAFFHPWADQWPRWLVWLTVGWLATYFVITVIAWGMIRHQERTESSNP